MIRQLYDATTSEHDLAETLDDGATAPSELGDLLRPGRARSTQASDVFQDYRIERLERRVLDLEQQVRQLASGGLSAMRDTRQVSLEDAIKEITILFESRPDLYYSDIADELNIDLEIIIAACTELQIRGLIRDNPE